MNIVISGTVGVGKSTLVKKLENHFKKNNIKSNFYYEKIELDNPMLEYFYQNNQEWSFLIQIDFLLDRFKNALQNSKQNEINIFDRHFLDDFIFVNSPVIHSSFSNFEMNIYNDINLELVKKLNEDARVDLFIRLVAPLETIKSRIKLRGRESELKIDSTYWDQLYDTYYHNSKVNNYLKKNVKHLYDLNIDNLDENEVFKKTLKIIEENKS